MADLDLMRQLHQPAETKIVLVVFDGLGGLPVHPGGPTELEAADTPNLDRMATEGALGFSLPVGPGITPGSGPGHLALFGYDPLFFAVGRGVLEATGVGIDVKRGDIAARGNFCTLDVEGNIVDRRAGRISSEAAQPLVDRLNEIELPGVTVEVRVAREYRFVVVMRGEGLEPEIADTDPLETGAAPLPIQATEPGSEHAARLFHQWAREARDRLRGEQSANGVTLRGFSTNPELPQFPEIYALKAACVAVYPMYRGVSRLVGMQVQAFEGSRPEDELAAVRGCWKDFDFVFLHIKKADSLGEDGDFDGKAAFLGQADGLLPELLALEPDVVAVTGDHSTPARMRYHSWHPVPLLLWAPATIRPDASKHFGETECSRGGLGTLQASDLMPLLMAHAGRLSKFGA